jgi:uncharacterized protein YgiM (DUF1202 family)
MALDPKKVIEIAKTEIGYLEKKNNSNLDSKTANAGSNNYTKYGRDLDAIDFYNGNKNGIAWCDQFVDWCFVQVFGKEVALEITFQPKKASSNCGAGCQYSRGYYQKNGRLFNEPEAGDQIFFWNSDKSRVSHTGLVISVDETYVHTIEGNTSGASGVVANGGGVKQKKYKLNYNRLAGYGRPNWDYSPEQPIEPLDKEEPLVTLAIVTGGSVHVREKPSPSARNLGYVYRGDHLVVRSDTIENGFVAVDFNGKDAWITSKYVKFGTVAQRVQIVNGNCNVRTEPNTDGRILGTVRKGTTHAYAGETSENGWLKIFYEGRKGWVSGKYAELKEG